jgi:hypothetical protein
MYRFAFTGESEEVDIDTVTNENRAPYYYRYDAKTDKKIEMSAVLTNTRTRHFRQKNANGSLESAEHDAAKRAAVKSLCLKLDNVEFYYWHNGETKLLYKSGKKSDTANFNLRLKVKAQSAKAEVTIRGINGNIRRADAVFYGENEQILCLIEIAHKHPMEPEKILELQLLDYLTFEIFIDAENGKPKQQGAIRCYLGASLSRRVKELFNLEGRENSDVYREMSAKKEVVKRNDTKSFEDENSASGARIELLKSSFDELQRKIKVAKAELDDFLESHVPF